MPQMTIRIAKWELDLIAVELNKNQSYFTVVEINTSEVLLLFSNVNDVLELDGIIKEKLVYQGLDKEYKTNRFGKMCENVIDKLYEMLE